MLAATADAPQTYAGRVTTEIPDAHGKRAVRAAVRASRRARSAAERGAADAAIARHGAELAERLGARTVACYLSTPSEPGTRGLLRDLSERGVRVLLPRPHEGGALDWVLAGEGERVHAMGVPEPLGAALGSHAIGEADLVFVPAAAVDDAGGRLGWGGGYYDRALQRLPRPTPIVAIVFDDDVVPTLALEPHDVRVTGRLTPSGFRAATAVDGASTGR